MVGVPVWEKPNIPKYEGIHSWGFEGSQAPDQITEGNCSQSLLDSEEN